MPKAKKELQSMKSELYPSEKGVGLNLNTDAAFLQREVGNYIQEMAAELAELAYQNHLNALAVACDVVREVAAGNVNSRERHVDYAPII